MARPTFFNLDTFQWSWVKLVVLHNPIHSALLTKVDGTLADCHLFQSGNFSVDLNIRVKLTLFRYSVQCATVQFLISTCSESRCAVVPCFRLSDTEVPIRIHYLTWQYYRRRGVVEFRKQWRSQSWLSAKGLLHALILHWRSCAAVVTQ